MARLLPSNYTPNRTYCKSRKLETWANVFVLEAEINEHHCIFTASECVDSRGSVLFSKLEKEIKHGVISIFAFAQSLFCIQTPHWSSISTSNSNCQISFFALMDFYPRRVTALMHFPAKRGAFHGATGLNAIGQTGIILEHSRDASRECQL